MSSNYLKPLTLDLEITINSPYIIHQTKIQPLTLDLTTIVNDVIIKSNDYLTTTTLDLTTTVNDVTIKSNVATPFTLDLTTTVNDVTIKSNVATPFTISLITTVNSPTIISSNYLKPLAITLTTTVKSPYIIHQTKIKPLTLDLTTSIIDLKYFGGRWDSLVIPYATRLRTFVNYLPMPISNIVHVDTINLNFDIGKYLNNNVRVFATTINLTTSIFTFPLWNFDKKPRVVKINDINIKPSMYFTNNRTKLLTSSKMYVTGNTKFFKTTLHTSSETITTDNDFALDYATVKGIYGLLDSNFTITLSNGEVLPARFDISNSPFQGERIYKGGIGFYLTLKVLIYEN